LPYLSYLHLPKPYRRESVYRVFLKKGAIMAKNFTVFFKRVSRDSTWPIPTWATEGAAGLDLRASLEAPWVVFNPGDIKLIPTGWAIALPQGYEGQIRPRSGLALKTGLTIINSPGTIDSDYRGELAMAMINHGRERVTIHYGDRIGQLVISQVFRPVIEIKLALEETERGAGSFGSTGV
jgi:dUTP pyrophosphatase